MASGDTLCIFRAIHGFPPSDVTAATPNVRNGHFVYEFDAATDWFLDFEDVLPRNYAGGGLTITVAWMAASGTTGACRWQIGIERQDTGTDLDANSIASTQSGGNTTSATSGAPTYTTITFTNGAQMDSLAVGECFRLRINRDADGTSGTDDMTGLAQLLAIEIRET